MSHIPEPPERDNSKPAEQQGIFRKFIVDRVDGSSAPGRKHHNCECFVLDVDHDPHAKAALAAYAVAVRPTHPELAADMVRRYALAAQPEKVDLGSATGQADAHLRALLRYTENFYGSAISHGMKAGQTANAIAHVERAGKALHMIVHAQAKAAFAAQPGPIDMVLHCPKCGEQHIDAPESDEDYRDKHLAHGGFDDQWTNPPHRTHLCDGCGHQWRPADVPTNGVAAVKTKGKYDSPIAATPVAVNVGQLRHQIVRLEAENAALQKTSTGTLSPVAVSAIGQWLADAMAVAVDNGANSVSMPDEFVEIAAWLASMDGSAVVVQAPVEPEAELAGLRRFAGKVLLSAREHMGDVDGGDIQGWAVESGLLKEVQATEPCGEHCECASVGDFPLACFVYTGAGLSALEAAKESP